MEFGFGHVEFEVSVACVSEAECGLPHESEPEWGSGSGPQGCRGRAARGRSWAHGLPLVISSLRSVGCVLLGFMALFWAVIHSLEGERQPRVVPHLPAGLMSPHAHPLVHG